MMKKSEIDRLLAKQDYEIRNDLRRDLFDNGTYYLFPDGGLLWLQYYDQGIAHYYASIEQMQQMRKEAELIGKQPPKHLLSGLILEGADFPKATQRYTSELAKLLDISLEQLNGTFESLKLVDTAIKTQRIGFKRYIKSVYPLVLAYCGEVIIHHTGGKWKMEHNALANVWEPRIEFPDGRVVPFFVELFEDAQEDYKNYSIYETAQQRLSNPFWF